MKHRREVFITAFALFSLFFGAGNLILPPFLGYNAGSQWFWVTIGFALSAVVIPILAISAHARLQGTMMDFATPISKGFALIYCLSIYAISIALPAPRTAAVTHEMAIAPSFAWSSLWTSTVYFILVLVFAWNRTKLVGLIGKYLTPLILIILLLIIVLGLFSEAPPLRDSLIGFGLSAGILEGYQTFDAIGGVVVGGVIVISLRLYSRTHTIDRTYIISRAGLLAGLGLFAIYAGLIALGSQYSGGELMTNRSELLTQLSIDTLGGVGTTFLKVLVALACFTTAVGIVTGTADFIQGLFKDRVLAYRITAIIGAILGVVIGQFDVSYIIEVAVPALMFIYPLTIVLILLNTIPKQWTSDLLFRAVVVATLLFSIPDFIASVGGMAEAAQLQEYIPLAQHSLGWLLPALLTGIAVFVVQLRTAKRSS
ncbi:branched-chain amino acid transport system II carrier protein [Croceiramulus getboli]|nr:branched-chain amino acid transport system II carrier protein [Flavobacteriaceae bacterium YJPT1-3]